MQRWSSTIEREREGEESGGIIQGFKVDKGCKIEQRATEGVVAEGQGGATRSAGPGKVVRGDHCDEEGKRSNGMKRATEEDA